MSSKRRFLAVPAAMMIALGTVGLGMPAMTQAATPQAAPRAVSAVTATAAYATGVNNRITVTWTAPTITDDTPNGFEILATPAVTGTAFTTDDSTLRSFTFSDDSLVVGTSYTFQVRAKALKNPPPGNVFGAYSAPTTPLLAYRPPAAPSGTPTATAGNASATVSWTALTNDDTTRGGLPFANYTVTSIPAGGQCTATVQTATSCIVTGLTNGTAYTFTVVANTTTPGGTLLASNPSGATAPVIPTAGNNPSPPLNVTAVAGFEQATVSWTAPTNSGASSIKEYRAYAYLATAIPAIDVTTKRPLASVSSCTVTGTPPATSCTLTGLTNGTNYRMYVQATNQEVAPANSESSLSAPSAIVTPGNPAVPGAPGTPTASAVAGTASATVTWTAPSSQGSSAITSYTVTGTPGGTCTVSGLTCTITGLTPGTSYTFTVRATNSVGTGAASAASNAVVPTGGVPGAPTGVTATAGNAQATVSWTAPASTGGSAITAYTVTSQSSLLGTPVRSCTTTGATTCTVTGLTNGVTYTFSVTATNAAGAGAASAASNAVTPGLVPGAPTGVTASAGDGQATVSWTAPTNTGGTAITGYTATASPGGRTCVTTGVTACEVTGLTNGTTYTFTVKARNAAGESAASAASNAVTPRGKATILIEGSRGTGSEDNMIFVDGITTDLVGKTVTPYFRFPGQSGFTAGTGTRTVDANGDFSWQRKTGKRIVVEFRTSDVTSNRIIIQAK